MYGGMSQQQFLVGRIKQQQRTTTTKRTTRPFFVPYVTIDWPLMLYQRMEKPISTWAMP